MANAVKLLRGTPLVFDDTTAAATTLILNNLAAGAARVSDRTDLGAGSTVEEFEWRATFQMATAGVVGETIDIYVSGSDGTLEDGDIGTIDAALTTVETLNNLQFVGSVVIETTSTTEDFRASGTFRSTSRHFSIVVHNNTADNLKATDDVNSVVVTPLSPEIQ